MSPLAYLLAVRARAANLLRYGAHLSPGLLDLARSLMPKDYAAHAASDGNGNANGNGTGSHAPREKFSLPDDDDGESPYRD